MANKQIRQLIESPTQVLVTDGVDPESNLGYYDLSSIGKDLLGVTTTSQGQEALSLVPGTHVQAYDDDLAAIASLSTTGAIERTGAGMAATFTVTNSAKQLLDDSSFASMRTTLELGSISTQSASNVAITGGSISGITDLAIADGGTGASTAQGAINALAGAVTSGQYLRGNGSNVVMSPIQAADVPILNQSTTGSAATLTTGRTIQTNLASTTAATFNGSANITPGVTGILPLANGGTGASTAAAARTAISAVTQAAYSTSIATGDWTGSGPYTAAKTVSGILSTDVPFFDLDLSAVAFGDVSAKQADWAQVYRAVTSADTVTFYALTQPTETLAVSIKVVR